MDRERLLRLLVGVLLERIIELWLLRSGRHAGHARLLGGNHGSCPVLLELLRMKGPASKEAPQNVMTSVEHYLGNLLDVTVASRRDSADSIGLLLLLLGKAIDCPLLNGIDAQLGRLLLLKDVIDQLLARLLLLNGSDDVID